MTRIELWNSAECLLDAIEDESRETAFFRAWDAWGENLTKGDILKIAETDEDE